MELKVRKGRPYSTAHVRRMAQQEVGHGMASAGRRIASHRIWHRGEAGVEGKRTARRVIRIQGIPALPDFCSRLHRVAPLDPGQRLTDLVIVKRVALCEAVTANAGKSLPADIGNPPISPDRAQAGQSDFAHNVTVHRHLLAIQIHETVR